ncbi:MAG: hypothetical protein ACRDM0_27555, partial [Thermoleophilaceae bacterium]
MLEEERISLGCIDDLRALVARETLGRVESRDELLGLVGTQGFKSENRGRAIRLPFQYFWPRETDEENRSVVADLENVLNEIQKARLCPV